MARRYDYDLLRICSMLGVIYLHVASGALRTLDYVALWNFSNCLVAVATPAVPLFFIMSGALLLQTDKTADLDVLFRRRLPKVLLPLLAWSAVIIGYKVLRHDLAGAWGLLSQLPNTPALVPYWFLYALIPIYLLSPLLKVMTDHLTDRQWNYMMGLWVFLTLGLYTARSFAPASLQGLLTEHWTLNVNLVGGYLGYFLLGAYLERQERVPSKKVLAALVAALVALSIFGTRWDTFRRLAYSDRFTNYLSLFTMVLSSAIFLLAKACLRGRESRGKLFPLLAGNSFGVYLLHAPVLLFGEKLWTRLTGLPGPATIPQQLLFYGAAVAISVAGAVLLASIPGACQLFTGQSWAAACKSSNLQALFRRKSGERP